MFSRHDARAPRRLASILLLLLLFPGWVLPPECAACPHASDAAHASDAGGHGHEHVVGEHHPGADEDHTHRASPEPDANTGDEQDHHGEDCGCPCDVQCTAPGLPAPASPDVRPSGLDAQASTSNAPSGSRPAAPAFPPHFLPLSNAPPR